MRKKILALTALIMATALFTACGQKNNEESGSHAGADNGSSPASIMDAADSDNDSAIDLTDIFSGKPAAEVGEYKDYYLIEADRENDIYKFVSHDDCVILENYESVEAYSFYGKENNLLVVKERSEEGRILLGVRDIYGNFFIAPGKYALDKYDPDTLTFQYKESSGYGLVDVYGKVIVKAGQYPEDAYVSACGQGARIRYDGAKENTEELIVVNAEGKEIFRKTYEKGSYIFNCTKSGAFCIHEGDNHSFYDSKGKLVYATEDDCDYDYGYICVSADGSEKYYSVEGFELMIDTAELDNCGSLRALSDEILYIDYSRNGQSVVRFYEYGGSFLFEIEYEKELQKRFDYDGKNISVTGSMGTVVYDTSGNIVKEEPNRELASMTTFLNSAGDTTYTYEDKDGVYTVKYIFNEKKCYFYNPDNVLLLEVDAQSCDSAPNNHHYGGVLYLNTKNEAGQNQVDFYNYRGELIFRGSRWDELGAYVNEVGSRIENTINGRTTYFIYAVDSYTKYTINGRTTYFNYFGQKSEKAGEEILYIGNGLYVITTNNPEGSQYYQHHSLEDADGNIYAACDSNNFESAYAEIPQVNVFRMGNTIYTADYRELCTVSSDE